MPQANEPIVGEEYDVFISYAHADKEAYSDRSPAQTLAALLEGEGYSVWWDRDLLLGQDWARELARKVGFARKVIALCSPRWVASDWCRREEFRAYETEGKLIPVIIEACDLPDRLARLQRLSATGELSLYLGPLKAALGPPARKAARPAAPSALMADDIWTEGLPTSAGKLIGRDSELTMLHKAWNSGNSGAPPADKTNIVVLHAIGGAGKSALMRAFLDAQEERGFPGAAKVYGWSAYSQGSGDNRNADADGFIARALTFFGYDNDARPITDPVERGRMLARLIRKQRTLLVLDGLEPLQDLPHVNDGRLKDKGLQTLVTQLARDNPGLVVITSRQELPELKQKAFDPPKVVNHALDQLSDVAGAELLRHLGVHGRQSELMAASHDVGGHALTVNLLGTYLSSVCAGDVTKRDTLKLAELIDDGECLGDRRAKRAAHIMDAYVERFAALTASQARGEGDPERMILSLVGLFDRPAEADAIAAVLAAPPIAGLTDGWHALTEQQRKLRWDFALKRLRALKLLANEDAANPGGLDAHPVVRQHFGRKLMEDQPDAFRAANRRLYEHYGSVMLSPLFRTPEGFGLLQLANQIEEQEVFQLIVSVLAEGSCPEEVRDRLPAGLRNIAAEAMADLINKVDADAFQAAQEAYLPSNLSGMQPLFAAIGHGCAAGLVQEAFDDVYGARVLQGKKSFINKQLGGHSADLGALAHFFAPPWRRPHPALTVPTQAVALNYAGFSLRALGRLREAVEPMRADIAIDAGREYWEGAAPSASNLSELLLTLGDVADSVAAGREAVVYADQSGNVFRRMVNCSTLADALHQAGETGEAAALLAEAERLQAEHQPELPRLYSLWGYRLCDLLLGQDRHEEVAERGKYALHLVMNGSRNLLDIALNTLSIGRATHMAWQFAGSLSPLEREELRDTARRHLDAAVEGLRKAGQEAMLPFGLLSRTALRRDCGEFDGCQQDLEEVHEIASRGGMRLHLADCYLEWGRMLLVQDPGFAHADTRRFAEQCVMAAHTLIQATGYHRRDGELAALRTALDEQPK